MCVIDDNKNLKVTYFKDILIFGGRKSVVSGVEKYVVMIEAQVAGLPCLISDRVPIECKKTGLVYQISLNNDPKDWVDKIIKLASIERKNTTKEIKKAGFDIEENAEKLVKFYIEKIVS